MAGVDAQRMAFFLGALNGYAAVKRNLAVSFNQTM